MAEGYELAEAERTYLRGLAQRQAELAALPIMQKRRQRWTDTNDAKPGAPPPVAIETWTFGREFLPEDIFRCTSEYGRRLEAGFLRPIRQHEILNDDHVCPDTLDMGWHVWSNEFGIEIGTRRAEGEGIAYRFECPIQDLNDGFDFLQPTRFGVDREGTREEKAFLEEAFGDILPVTLRSGVYGATYLTQRLVHLMTMETFLMAMYDCPEKLHGIMAYLRDNAISFCRWAEGEGLLELNNGNQSTCGTCFNFTTLLSTREVAAGQVKLSDMWAGMDSQETVGVSPALFQEFIYPYYAELAAMFGLVYWGCCEPAGPIWEKSLSQLPNLKAVSISRWANQDYMAEALQGTGIVFSRKPNPNLLGVSADLDEEAWAAEIRETLEATAGRNVPVEFVVRDVYTVHGNLDKPRRAVEIARSEIARYF